MKLKGFFTFLGLLMVALLAISFFLPKDMNTTVTKQLKAAPEQVFAQVNELKNWENWSPWSKMDTAMEITYGEKHIGVGGSYAWKSSKKKVGNGAIIIDESNPNEKLSTILKFEGFENATSKAVFTIAPAESGSSVAWSYESDYSARWPWQRYGMAMGRMMMKKAFAEGLDGIDSYVAGNPGAHLIGIEENTALNIEISETEAAPFQGIAVNRKGTISDLEAKGAEIYGQAYGEVGKMIADQGLAVSGMPFSQAIVWDEAKGTFEIEIGLPVAEGGKQFGGGKVVKASYYGPYSGVGAAYEAIEAYCAEKRFEYRGGPWEIYVTDPGLEPDTSKWLTEVYFPIK